MVRPSVLLRARRSKIISYSSAWIIVHATLNAILVALAHMNHLIAMSVKIVMKMNFWTVNPEFLQ